MGKEGSDAWAACITNCKWACRGLGDVDVDVDVQAKLQSSHCPFITDVYGQKRTVLSMQMN